MDAKEPLANENIITPDTIIIVQNNFSLQVEIEISPYPTVVMV